MSRSGTSISDLRRDLTASQHRVRELEHTLAAERERNAAAHQHQQATIVVLRSDRDRLTAALDVCARRLASPYADQEASRGGWRYANQLAPTAQKVSDPEYR